jgi:putative ABC transport system permease protein
MTLLQDLKYALRTLSSRPGFTAIAIGTIALAIGVNSAMFSFFNGTVLNPLPYDEPERLVRLFERPPNGLESNVSSLNYADWAEQNTVFENVAARALWGATLTTGGEPLRLRAARVSAAFFDINGTRPAIGRPFRSGEDEPGNDHVVLLSHALWESRFGSDPTLVGRNIVLDGEPYVVIGILPRGSAFDRSFAQLWKPLAFQPSERTRNFHWIDVFAKLAPGVTLDQARAEMDVIARRIAQEHPDSNKGWGVTLAPLEEVVVGPRLRTAAMVLFAATSLVLLIGCANLASLALARGISRDREIGIRASLGASRWRLARQFLTESLLLSIGGGIVGIGVAYLALAGLRALLPPFALPAEVTIRMDVPVTLFALAASAVTGLLFGLAPAVQASKTDLVGAIKGHDRGSMPGTPGGRLRSGLVVIEVALAFVLLVGAGLLVRTLTSLLEVDSGFDSRNVLTAGLPVSASRYADPLALNTYLDAIREAVEAVPGVDETALTSAIPLQGPGYGMPYQIADRELVELTNRPWGFFKMVSASYFRTLSIELEAGRSLRDTDTAGAPRVVVVNESFARQNFPNEDPIGKRLFVQQIVPGQLDLGPEIPWEIVGVIKDEKINSLSEAGVVGMYVSNRQSPVYSNNLIVRANVDPQTLQRSIRAAIDGVDKSQALSNVRTLEQIEAQSVVDTRLQSTLLGVFAVVALLLAGVGIYGVISYTVAQRAREMGIRAALGARTGDLLSLVFRGGMRLVVIGLAIGVAAALATTRIMGTMLYGVSVRDPKTMVIVALVLGATASFACIVPARRITRIDPNVALRGND